MRKLLVIILSAALMSFAPSAFLFSPPDTNAKFKAVYVYNFPKYFEWPSSYKEGTFIIGVLGSSTLTPELTTMATTKTIGTQKCEVKIFNTIEEVKKCHILFVPGENAIALNKVLTKMKGTSTLLITEKDGYAKQGSMINFVVQSNKIKFELNRNAAEKFDLKVSQALQPLAIMVD